MPSRFEQFHVNERRDFEIEDVYYSCACPLRMPMH